MGLWENDGIYIYIYIYSPPHVHYSKGRFLWRRGVNVVKAADEATGPLNGG